MSLRPQDVKRINCVICNTPFPRVAGNMKTCSVACSVERRKQSKRQWKEQNWERHCAHNQASVARKREREAAAFPEIVAARARRGEKRRQPTTRECVECAAPFFAKNNVKTCSAPCWEARFRRLRCRPQRALSQEERLARKRAAYERLQARRMAADLLVREIINNGLEALL